MNHLSIFKKNLSQIFLLLSIFLCVIIFSASHLNDLLIRFEAKTPTFLFHTTTGMKLFGAKRLPTRGKNFESYSPFFSLLGRTHVHSKVRHIILHAYQMLEVSAPSTIFIYGETGWKNGGNFWPHKTHRNGLCVDFIVPVIDINTNQPRKLFLHPFNLYGYNTRFNQEGINGNLKIDFHTIVEHLYALKISCYENNITMERVIIDPPLLKHIQNDADFEFINDLPFMQKQAWVHHDSHYHIEFAL